MPRDIWITSTEQLQELIRTDRLRPLLVRCGRCRFTAPAQDVPFLVEAINKAGDYVRDISFPSTVTLSPAIWARACEYLEKDRKAHLRAHGSWHLDTGKLETAFQASEEEGDPDA